MAIENLQEDICKVCGTRPELGTEPKRNCIIIGSYGSALISRLTADGKLEDKELKGKNEKYILTVVGKPMEGVDKALVIAGSDKRGCIYGIYKLSELIGVSPWVWFADVAPEKKEELKFSAEELDFVSKEPSVKYRGIFINDESPSNIIFSSLIFSIELL